MSWETICPDCGARLDPGEKCDCGEHKKEKPPKMRQHLMAAGVSRKATQITNYSIAEKQAHVKER